MYFLENLKNVEVFFQKRQCFSSKIFTARYLFFDVLQNFEKNNLFSKNWFQKCTRPKFPERNKVYFLKIGLKILFGVLAQFWKKNFLVSSRFLNLKILDQEAKYL